MQMNHYHNTVLWVRRFLLIFLMVKNFCETGGQVCLNPPNFNCVPGVMQMPLMGARMFIDPLKLTGTWYEFMALNPAFPYKNLIAYFTQNGNPLSAIFAGTDTNPNDTLTGVFMNVTVALLTSPDNACVGNFETTFLANDGRIEIYAMLPSLGVTRPVYLYYEILFTDYANLTIYSLCTSMDIPGNRCDKATISVMHRIRPGQLSADQKTYIKTMVDSTMKPFCLSSTDFQFSIWNGTLPACSPVPPANYVALTQAVGTLTA